MSNDESFLMQDIFFVPSFGQMALTDCNPA